MTLPEPPSGDDFDRHQPPLQRHLGFRLRPELAGAQQVVVEAPVSSDVVGPAGLYQGGALATLVDTAGAICASWHSGGKMVATQDMTVSYLAPGKVGPIRATASLLRAGSTAIVVEVRCTDEGMDGRLVGVGLVTCMTIGPRPPGLSERPPPERP